MSSERITHNLWYYILCDCDPLWGYDQTAKKSIRLRIPQMAEASMEDRARIPWSGWVGGWQKQYKYYITQFQYFFPHFTKNSVQTDSFAFSTMTPLLRQKFVYIIFSLNSNIFPYFAKKNSFFFYNDSLTIRQKFV